MAADKEPTVIKKYANRRLYHTGTSSYVTLEDLAGLVREGEEFVVYDAKSGEDITRSVLAQIIFEEENKTGQNLLPITFLRQLIKFYGDQMQVVVPRYLEMSIDTLTREQSMFREHLSSAFGPRIFEAMEAQTRANMKIFADAFRMFTPFAPTSASSTAPTSAPTAAPPAAAPTKAENTPAADDDIEALRREMAAMRDKLDKLDKR
jgi:polyhydroxyalkanoate synthesis repressor PhaR